MSTDDEDNVIAFPHRPLDVKALVAGVRAQHETMANRPSSGDARDAVLASGNCPDCGKRLVVAHEMVMVSWEPAKWTTAGAVANVLYWHCDECNRRHYPDSPAAVLRAVLDYLASEWFVTTAAPEHLEQLQRIVGALAQKEDA